MVVSGWVGLLVVVAVVEHGLAGDALLSTSDGCDFPDGPGRPVPNVPSLDRLGIAFAGGGALHLGVAVRVDGTQLLVLVLHSTRERVGNVVIVIVLTLALHEEAGALHKLVHGHGASLLVSQPGLRTAHKSQGSAPNMACRPGAGPGRLLSRGHNLVLPPRHAPLPLRPPDSRVRDRPQVPHSPNVDPLEICVKLVG